jgi:adenosylhomocysteine nucleosidase
MATAPLTVVCFAVKQEAKPFERTAKGRGNVRVVLTGMGRKNAERTVRALLEESRPELVISSGFAGGLKPDLATGTIVYAADADSELTLSLMAAGAVPVRFICSGRVAATALEKSALRQSTGAEAIEMESEAICSLCRQRQIPSATIRVILDAAHEDLALDFNRLMTSDQKLDWRKVFVTLMKSPQRLPALMRLQKRSAVAAERLAEVLMKVLVGPIGPH